MPTGTAVHGMDAGIKVGTKVLTTYKKTGNWEVDPGIHDTSGSGITDQTFRGGQIKRTFTVGGWTDDDTEAGPRYLETIAGTTVAIERYPAGIGAGKPKQAFNGVIGKYVESEKNDDIFQWTCDIQVTGAVTTGVQP